MVIGTNAQDEIPLRNCRPYLTQNHFSNKNSRRVSGLIGLEASKGALRAQDDNPYIGDKRQLVVMAAFKDQAFKGNELQTLEQWNKIFNASNYSEESFFGSVHDYFYDQSYGQFRLTFDLFYMVVDNMIKYKSTYYNDENTKYLVQDIMAVLKDRVDDWAPYDWDGDGYVDQLLIIYSGKGQNDGGGSNTIWAHQMWLSVHSNCEPITVYSNGKEYIVDKYCCAPELDRKSNYGSFGTICHEYSHCFGLPDFYYGGTSYLNTWDIMDSGNFIGNGFIPCGYSAFERIFMGWMSPLELITDTVLYGISALVDKPQAYIIRNEGHPDEYYILENRQKTGWDSGLPGSGIIVSHVDYDEQFFLKGRPNDSERQRYSIFPANNKRVANDRNVTGWAYPYEGNNELTNTSTPAATLFYANTDSTFLMSKPITGMKVIDGLASFRYSDLISGIPYVSEESRNLKGQNAWFTIDGRRITGKPSVHGLYIHEGKLVLIR